MKLNKEKRRKILIVCLVVITAMLCCISQVMALERIGTAIDDGVKQTTVSIASIAYPVAGLSIAIGGIKILMGTVSAAEEGKSLIIKTIIGIAFVICASSIARLFTSGVTIANWGGWG